MNIHDLMTQQVVKNYKKPREPKTPKIKEKEVDKEEFKKIFDAERTRQTR